MIEWRASLVPEASVMPARLMYGKFIAVVTFVVSFFVGVDLSKKIYCEKMGVFKGLTC